MQTGEWIDFVITETESALALFYSYTAFQHLLSDKTAATAANKNPDFWMTHSAALQQSLFLYLGRLSDDSKDAKSFPDFTTHCITHIQDFSRSAFMRRRPNILNLNPRFLDASATPSKSDLSKLFKLASPHNSYLRGECKTIRSEVFAHAILTKEHEYSHLFKNVTLDRIERALLVLWSISKHLWESFHNARTITPTVLEYTEKEVIYESTKQVLIQSAV